MRSKKVKKLFYYILLLALSIYLFALAFLYVYQKKLMYFPSRQEDLSCKSFKLQRDGTNLNIYTLHPGKKSAIIYFGGNAENASASIEDLNSTLKDVTIYLPEYRGYGKSKGVPSEDAIKSDAISVFDEVKKSHKCVAVAGRSLGSGVAAYVAYQREAAALVLITPYDSTANVAQERYWGFPVKYLLKDKYETVRFAPNIATDTLILVAKKDRVISSKRTKALIQAMRRAKKSVVYLDKGHNSISQDERYYPIIEDFLREKLQGCQRDEKR